MAIRTIIMATMGTRILAIAEDTTIPTATTITEAEAEADTGTDHSHHTMTTPTSLTYTTLIETPDILPSMAARTV